MRITTASLKAKNGRWIYINKKQRKCMKKVYVISPMWRPQLCERLVGLMSPPEWCEWITVFSSQSIGRFSSELLSVIGDKATVLTADIQDDRLKAATDKISVGVEYLREKGKEGFVYLLGDDNALHPNFFPLIAESQDNDMIIGTQVRRNGTVYCRAAPPVENQFDAGQYLATTDLVFSVPVVSHENDNFAADGTWARLIYEVAKNPKIEPKPSFYYNYLRD